jgi:heme-degrading monooxygenase HmoA
VIDEESVRAALPSTAETRRHLVIAREWRAWAVPPNDAAYEQHFREVVLPHLREIAGCVGAHLLRRESVGEVELVAMSFFESPDAIRAFAGDDLERAVVEPEARRVLARFDERVRHYEIVATFGAP